jgi:hypothetical protein
MCRTDSGAGKDFFGTGTNTPTRPYAAELAIVRNVQFKLEKPCSIEVFPMGKVDWFAIALVVFGMLPVVMVAAVLFWRG